MKSLSKTADLKEITAYKKKLNWGEVPSIYHMAAYSISEIDAVLTHGFESSYKHILNRNLWNLPHLKGYTDDNGEIQITHKPQIMLQHVYTEQHYELHCLPVVNGEEIRSQLLDHPNSPFTHWSPETMQILFRASNLVSFMTFTFKSGDAADLALIHYAYRIIEEHIQHLRESFEIVEIKGRNLATISQQLFKHSAKFSEDDFVALFPAPPEQPTTQTD